MSDKLEHVSDTSLLVAAARAAETRLEDGLVRDPFALRLAGERGLAIARSNTHSPWRSFGIGMRSHFIDDILLSEIRSGDVDCVLCLGAGLDARPWRLPFPSPDFRWIEVDFAPVLDYKYGILKDEKPTCRPERMTADLNVHADRQRVLAAATAHGHRVLLLTEGLLFYLPGETVRQLAFEARVCSRWLMDISPATSFLLATGGDGMQKLNDLRHETRLEGSEIVATVEQSGWTRAVSKTFVRDAVPFAIKRMQTQGWKPDPNGARPSPDDPGGVWLFRQTED